MRDLINSMLRFSTAMTLFSFQQMQTAMGAAGADTDAAVSKFAEALDKVTDVLTGQIEEAGKPMFENVTKAGTDMLDRTWDTLRFSSLDPRTMVQASRDVLEKTADSLNDMMKKRSGDGGASAGEPKPAAEALAGQPPQAADTVSS